MMKKSNKTVFFFLGSLKVGGTEVVASRLQKSLMDRGYDIRYILLKDLIELPVTVNREDVLFLNTERSKSSLGKVLVAIKGLWKYYLRYKPVRIISFSSGLNILLLLSCLPNQVLTIDTNLFAVRSNLYRRRLLKIMGYLPNVKKVIVPSNGLRMEFEHYLPKRSYRKLTTIFNPIEMLDQNLECHPPGEHDKLILVSMGRLSEMKGFEQLIKCFARARFDVPVELLILGSGPMENKLRDLIAELHQQESIKLLGFQRYPQDHLCKAEGLILNSRFESFGNVLIEALFLGVPPLSNDCDFGPREIIEHNTNGILFDNSRDENLISVLEKFINDVELRKKLQSNTSRDLERFSIGNITSRWEQQVLS